MSNRLRKDAQKEQVQKISSIDEIAKAIGVSKSTVSRAISGKGRIGQETREKILSFIDLHGFKVNLIAKSLAVSRTFNIAVVTPTDAEVQEIPFFQGCLHAISQTITQWDYDVILSITTEHNISSVKRLVKNRKVDGIILTRPLIDDKAIDFLKETEVPFLVIGNPGDDTVVQIDSDHITGCRDATEHILRQRFANHVLLAGNPHHRVNQNRFLGYQSALQKQGIKIGLEISYHDLTTINKDRFNYPIVVWDISSQTAVDETLHTVMLQKPTCLICMDDVIASKTINYLTRHHIRIPQDIRLVSFHDSAAMEHNIPPISAVHVHITELGRLAGSTIINMIEGRPFEFVNKLPAEFVVRESSLNFHGD